MSNQPPTELGTHHEFFSVICGSNRRRKSIYLLVIAFSLALLLFAKESYFSSTPFATNPDSIIPPLDLPPSHTNAPIPDSNHTVDFTLAAVEPVAFTLIMWSEDSALEGALLIKSIILHNSRPSDIHIICDDKAEETLRKRLDLIQNPPRHVRVWFYKPTWESMFNRVEREGSMTTDHSAGLPGLMKLFIHEIIPPTVKKGIFIDTDALFISDPSLLWDVFAGLQPTTAIVMGSHPDQYAPEWNHASKICSCIMLLDLEKLRNMRLMDSSTYRSLDDFVSVSPAAFRAKYGEPSGDRGRYDNVRLGDQGYWWAIVDYRPDLFEPLPFDFEVTTCLLDTYDTGLGDELTPMDEELSRQSHVKGTPQEGKVVLPKLLHFNCLHGSALYYDWPGWSEPENIVNIRWGHAVAYHKGYKWIWLNQGPKNSPEHIIEMFTIVNVKFMDEVTS